MATQAVQKKVEDEQGVEGEDLLLPTEKIPGFRDLEENKEEVSAKKDEERKLEEDDDADDFTEKVPFLKNVPTDVSKPERVVPRDEADEEYFDEHKGLPVQEERPAVEVAAEEEHVMAERKKVAADIEAHKDEVGTIDGLEREAIEEQGKPANIVAVEGILSEGLEEAYKSMTVDERVVFRHVGEATAVEVATMLDQAKIKFKAIVKLIAKWLGLLPKVNKHFIEQESKIKLDHLLKYKKETEGTEME